MGKMLLTLLLLFFNQKQNDDDGKCHQDRNPTIEASNQVDSSLSVFSLQLIVSIKIKINQTIQLNEEYLQDGQRQGQKNHLNQLPSGFQGPGHILFQQTIIPLFMEDIDKGQKKPCKNASAEISGHHSGGKKTGFEMLIVKQCPYLCAIVSCHKGKKKDTRCGNDCFYQF